MADIAAAYAQRRSGALGIYVDPPPGIVLGSPPATPARENSRRASPRTPNERVLLLPSWYPRRALGDVTDVVRAVERRRARLAENDGQPTVVPLVWDDEDEENDDEMGGGGGDNFLTAPPPAEEEKKVVVDEEEVVRELLLERLRRRRRVCKEAEWQRKVRILMSMR